MTKPLSDSADGREEEEEDGGGSAEEEEEEALGAEKESEKAEVCSSRGVRMIAEKRKSGTSREKEKERKKEG